MSDQQISKLRQRMIEDMTIRGFTADTQNDYVRSVKYLAHFIGRSPDTATPEEIRQFQLSLRQEGASSAKMNAIVSGLRFFFRVTLDQPGIERWTQFVREPRKLPVILSPEEVARLIDHAPITLICGQASSTKRPSVLPMAPASEPPRWPPCRSAISIVPAC